jgi:hypothetical protein
MEHGAQTSQALPIKRTGVRARLAGVDTFQAAVAGMMTVAAVFLFHQLMAWPPHEDEALALLVGRDSLGGVIEHVTRDRGGAPLHFLVAWLVSHVGLGLGALRVVSALFALASLPLIALLATRLVDRRAAVLTTAFAAASWMFLFHGVYGRMYSLFFFLALASYLLLLGALGGGGRRAWGAWLGVTLLCVAAHPYAALVVAGQGLAVLLLRRDLWRSALAWFAALGVLGTPFWLTDIVLAGRFDVGVGGGGAKLGGPTAVLEYLYATAGDMTAGWTWVLVPILIVAAVGLLVAPRDARHLSIAVASAPVAAFLIARLGSSTAPESRHLLFVMPFFLLCLSLGLIWLARSQWPAVAFAALLLCVANVAWAWHKTPALFEREPAERQAARAEASAYLAAQSKPDDLLLGYDPLFLGAWERRSDFPTTILPRADATLALRVLERVPEPLGHGVWVLDRSDTSNRDPQLFIADHSPLPKSAFVTRNFGPFLVIRTRDPVVDIDGYLFHAMQAMLLGQKLGLGDADINRSTIERAQAAYDALRWPSASASSSSR